MAPVGPAAKRAGRRHGHQLTVEIFLITNVAKTYRRVV